MIGIARATCLGILMSVGLASVGHAQLTADELKGQAGTNRASAKFTALKSSCISKCLAAHFKAGTPKEDCLAPSYVDPTVNTCIFGAVKGAEPAAQAAFVKATAKDCPECYSSGDCNADAASRVANLESQIDPFGGIVACSDTPTAPQFKCETAVAKILVKYVAGRGKCYDKCFATAFSAGSDPSICMPPTTDPATSSCLSAPSTGTEAKASAAIDKACYLPHTDPPCYSSGGLTSGDSWSTLVGTAIDGNVPSTYCGS